MVNKVLTILCVFDYHFKYNRLIVLRIMIIFQLKTPKITQVSKDKFGSKFLQIRSTNNSPMKFRYI